MINVLELVPPDRVTLYQTENKNLHKGYFTIKNHGHEIIAWRIATQSKAKYRAIPCMGVLLPQQFVDVSISFHFKESAFEPDEEDSFMVMGSIVQNRKVNPRDLIFDPDQCYCNTSLLAIDARPKKQWLQFPHNSLRYLMAMGIILAIVYFVITRRKKKRKSDGWCMNC